MRVDLRLLGGVVVGVALCTLAVDCGPAVETGEGLSNAISLQTPNSPLVTFRLGVRAGSINDPPGKNGLNALTALMVGRGGTESMSYEAITEAIYPWSASLTAQFDKEMTMIIGEVHRDHLDPFYAIVRDLVVTPRFDETDFTRNRDFLTNAVVSTLRGGNDEELGKQTLNALLYEGHPYESTEMGTEQGLATLTIDDVRALSLIHI